MNAENLFNLFLLISAIHGFLFSILLYFSKSGKEKSMIFINLLVLAISLNNLQSWILAKNFFSEYFFIDYVHIPWHFLIAPFFYMFLMHYLKIAHKTKNILKFIIPIFLVIVLVRIVFVFNYSNENTKDVVFIFERYTSIEEIISLIFSLGIFGYSFHILHKKENLFQKILSFDDLKWIYTFFKLGALTYIFWIIALAITVALNFTEFIYSYYPLRILTTVLIYWIGYQSLMQLRIVKERETIRKQLVKTIKPKEIIEEEASSNTTEDQQLFNKINAFVTEHKKFTEPKLTLELLAKDVDVSVNKLSNLINTCANKSFNDYINQLRVNQAKQLLADKTYCNYTITAIGLESGFNSKSTFYYTFKKLTDSTPLAYQKAHLNDF